MQNVHRFLNMVFSPGLVLAKLRLALGITIFSKSAAHGYFLENRASGLFNIVNNVSSIKV